MISFGVTGRKGDIDGVWIAPVTAHVMITLREDFGILAAPYFKNLLASLPEYFSVMNMIQAGLKCFNTTTDA